MLKYIKQLLTSVFKKSYGSELEQYIIARNPTHPGDVERLTLEYNSKTNRQHIYHI
jgi:hypothetical protein